MSFSFLATHLFAAGGKAGDAVYGAPAWDTTGQAFQSRKENKKINEELFGTPRLAAMVKSIFWFGGPLAAMIYANRKLKKHDEATRIKLREQNLMQGGANPMAQLMAMMQGAGAGGFPTAEVRNPMAAHLQEKEEGDQAETGSQGASVKIPSYEKDILSTAMKRFGQAFLG